MASRLRYLLDEAGLLMLPADCYRCSWLSRSLMCDSVCDEKENAMKRDECCAVWRYLLPFTENYYHHQVYPFLVVTLFLTISQFL